MGLAFIRITIYIVRASGQESQIFGPTYLINQLIGALVGGVISGSVISVVLGVLFNRKTTIIKEEIGHQFEIIRSQRMWKEQSVAELLGPVNMLLDRTDLAFDRWSKNALFLEAEIVGKSNRRIRDMLLEKGHLIPPELLGDASKLINHYDRWLEKYEENRKNKDPKHQDPFTFTGPEGYPFPRQSALKFQECFRKYWSDLYKTET